MTVVVDVRKRDLARIHVLKAELKLDREQYEAVLWTIGKVDSSARLDAHGRRALISHLQAHVDRARGRAVDPERPNNLEARPQLRKIAAQLNAAGRTWSYARGVQQKLYGRSTIEFADSRELSGVIAALEADAKRHGRPTR